MPIAGALATHTRRLADWPHGCCSSADNTERSRCLCFGASAGRSFVRSFVWLLQLARLARLARSLALAPTPDKRTHRSAAEQRAASREQSRYFACAARSSREEPDCKLPSANCSLQLPCCFGRRLPRFARNRRSASLLSLARSPALTSRTAAQFHLCPCAAHPNSPLGFPKAPASVETRHCELGQLQLARSTGAHRPSGGRAVRAKLAARISLASLRPIRAVCVSTRGTRDSDLGWRDSVGGTRSAGLGTREPSRSPSRQLCSLRAAAPPSSRSQPAPNSRHAHRRRRPQFKMAARSS